jgi:hypothetical protein
LRKLILDDIEAVRRGQAPRSLVGSVKIDSFTGVRAKGIF